VVTFLHTGLKLLELFATLGAAVDQHGLVLVTRLQVSIGCHVNAGVSRAEAGALRVGHRAVVVRPVCRRQEARIGLFVSLDGGEEPLLGDPLLLVRLLGADQRERLCRSAREAACSIGFCLAQHLNVVCDAAREEFLDLACVSLSANEHCGMRRHAFHGVSGHWTGGCPDASRPQHGELKMALLATMLADNPAASTALL